MPQPGHVTLVHVRVKPGREDAFLDATRANHVGSVAEAGNRRFDVLQAADDPARFVLYEWFATEADAKAHKQTAHYLGWRDAVAEMMAEPRRGEAFRGVLPNA